MGEGRWGSICGHMGILWTGETSQAAPTVQPHLLPCSGCTPCGLRVTTYCAFSDGCVLIQLRSHLMQALPMQVWLFSVSCLDLCWGHGVQCSSYMKDLALKSVTA